MQNCKYCKIPLALRETKKSSRQKAQNYYYTNYYYCSSCHRIFHDEKFKITKPQTVAFNFEDSATTIEDDQNKNFIEIWTDGACVYNGTPKAKAAWAFVAGAVEQSGVVEGKQTNNRGEGLAILQALYWAGKAGYKNIVLNTDSQVSLHSINKEPEKVVANRDIFIGIADTIKKYKLQVTYKKVLGHAGNVNNERADKLANTRAQELLTTT